MEKCEEDQEFQRRFIWSDEATFKLSGPINRHNCTHWARENPHIMEENRVNLPGVAEDTINDASYFNLLHESIMPIILEDFADEGFYFPEEELYHITNDVRAYLNENLPDRWTGRSSPVEYPQQSPNLTPLDYFLCFF